MDAAEKVCADERFSEQVLELLGRLVDKSLVSFDANPIKEPRYRMLETVRQYGREQLVVSDEERMLRERHLDYFLSLAEQAEPRLREPGAKDWLDRLERELDKLCLSLDWSISSQDWQSLRNVEKGLHLASCLHWFWLERGHTIEGTEWLEKLLQGQISRSESQARGRVDHESLDQDSRSVRGRALNVLGLIILYNSEKYPHRTEKMKQRRKELAWESQAIFQALQEESGDRPGAAYQTALLLSSFIQSETVEDVLACREQFLCKNELFWTAECDAFLTDFFLYYATEKIDERAVQCAEESLALHKEVRDQYGVGEALFALSNFALIWENEDRAIQLATEGIHSMEAIGDQDRASVLRARYVLYLTEVGDFQEAARQLEQLHTVAFTCNSRFLYLEHQRLWANLAWNMGKYELAAQYCQEVLEYRESLPADIAQLAIYITTRVCLSQGNCSQVQTYLRVFL